MQPSELERTLAGVDDAHLRSQHVVERMGHDRGLRSADRAATDPQRDVERPFLAALGERTQVELAREQRVGTERAGDEARALGIVAGSSASVPIAAPLPTARAIARRSSAIDTAWRTPSRSNGGRPASMRRYATPPLGAARRHGAGGQRWSAPGGPSSTASALPAATAAIAASEPSPEPHLDAIGHAARTEDGRGEPVLRTSVRCPGAALARRYGPVAYSRQASSPIGRCGVPAGSGQV